MLIITNSIHSPMSFKTIISSILTTLFTANSTKPSSSSVCSNADNGSSMSSTAECAVCLSSMKGEKGTRVLPCLHEFHSTCINRWLAVPHSTCPICRFSMEKQEDRLTGGDHDHDKDSRRQECFTEEMVIWFSSFHVAGF